MTDESDHTRLVLLEQDVKELSRQLERNTATIQDMVDAWQSAKGFIAFMFLMSKISIALGVVWLSIKSVIAFGRTL